tara:strand:+ start:864 stop:1028 length:165 start_codon:yes stop_codon:yes gene_type:complete
MISLSYRWKCLRAYEVGKHEYTHIENVNAISYGTGEVEKRCFASGRYVATNVVI